MLEKEFEYLCESICSGDRSARRVSTVMNNLFYERFGMSYSEIIEQLRVAGTVSDVKNYVISIDIVTLFY